MLEVTEEERQRAIMLSRRKYETDLVSNALTIYSQGIEEDIARRMARMGFSVADIAKTIEYSEEYLKKILPNDDEKTREHEAGQRDHNAHKAYYEILKILAAYRRDTEQRLEKN